MQISVRSYLTAGTVAVVGAGSIALTPVLPTTVASPANLPVPTVAEVALTGTSFSISDVLGVLQNLGGVSGLPSAILDALQNLGGISVPGISGLPSDLLSSIAREFIKQTIPVVLDAAGPFLDYVKTAASSLLFGPDSLPATLIGVLPTVIGNVGSALGGGDFNAALKAITDGLAAPLNAVKEVIANVTTQFNAFVSGQLGTIVGALPAVLVAAVQKVIGVNLSDALGAISTVLENLFGGVLPFAGQLVNGRTSVNDKAVIDAGDDSEATEAEDSAAVEADDDSVPAAASVAAPRGAATRHSAAAAKVRAAAASAPEAPVVAEAPVAAEAPVVADAPVAVEAPAVADAPAVAENSAPKVVSLGSGAPAGKQAPRAKQTLRGKVAAARSAAVARATAAAEASK